MRQYVIIPDRFLDFSRADQILALTAAYDVYMDVLQKADEGLKFYSTLFSLVRTLDEAMEGVENACSLNSLIWRSGVFEVAIFSCFGFNIVAAEGIIN